MAFEDDVANDYTIFDGNEILTLIKDSGRGPSHANITGSVYGLSRKAIRQFAEALIEVQSDDRLIDLFVATMPANVEVENADVIQRASGQKFYVVNTNNKTFDSRWHSLCRKQPNSP